MATDKKPATCYLSNELEQALTEYCTSKGLVRDYKDGKKPQIGTAIVEILESHFFGSSDEDTSPPPDEISELKGMIYDLIHRVETLESTAPSTAPSNGLAEPLAVEGIAESTAPSTVESPVDNSASTVESTVESNGQAVMDTEPELVESTVPSTVESPVEDSDANSDSNNSSTPAEVEGEGAGEAEATNYTDSIVSSDRLTKAQLAERLGVKQKTIDNNKNGSHFKNWSFKKDPIGLAWEWEASSKRFKPIL